MTRSAVVLALCLLAAGADRAAAQATNPQKAPEGGSVPFFTKKNAKQNETVRIVRGTVLDEAGKPVSGAIVEVKDVRTSKSRTYTTKDDGQYRFDDLLRKNDYEFKASTRDAASPVRRVTQFSQSADMIVNLQLAKK